MVTYKARDCKGFSTQSHAMYPRSVCTCDLVSSGDKVHFLEVIKNNDRSLWLLKIVCNYRANTVPLKNFRRIGSETSMRCRLCSWTAVVQLKARELIRRKRIETKTKLRKTNKTMVKQDECDTWTTSHELDDIFRRICSSIGQT